MDNAELLEMAQELDGMERSVSSWEADFLESVLTRLREGRDLSEKQEAKLRQVHEKYLGDDSPLRDIEDDD